MGYMRIFACIPKPTKGDKIVSSKKLLILVAALAMGLSSLIGLTTASMAEASTTIHSRVFNYDFKPVSDWKSTRATWYGPGYVWNTCANGKILLPAGPKYIEKWRNNREKYVYLGAASLGNHFPLVYRYGSMKGTWIQLKYRGVTVVIPIVDTGPSYSGISFDLTTGTRSYLDWRAKKYEVKNYVPFSGVQYVTYRIVKKI
jgi:hypothetical protein